MEPRKDRSEVGGGLGGGELGEGEGGERGIGAAVEKVVVGAEERAVHW